MTNLDWGQRLFYDDLPIGKTFTTTGRTITEADVVAFAGLSGDYNSLHVDQHYAEGTAFGGRIAHGLLILSVASGLTTRLPVFAAVQESLLGMTSVSCSWPAATRIGDTIKVDLTFESGELTKSGTKGLVVERRVARNQSGEVVLDSTWNLLVARQDLAQWPR